MKALKVGTMFKMPSGEVLKVKSLKNSKGNFVARLFGLKGEWTDYFIEGESKKLNEFITEGNAQIVSSKSYPVEPENDRWTK